MNQKLFRQKSLDRIQSPESLNDYLRVSNPGVWLLLVSIIVLLIGAAVWGIFGRIESKLDVSVVSKDGEIVCHVEAAEARLIAEGMPVRIGELEGEIVSITNEANGNAACAVSLDTSLPDDIYPAEIITERIHPFSLILN